MNRVQRRAIKKLFKKQFGDPIIIDSNGQSYWSSEQTAKGLGVTIEEIEAIATREGMKTRTLNDILVQEGLQ